MYNLFGHSKFIFLLAILSCIVNAKSFENFKKSQSDSAIVYKYEEDNIFKNNLKSNWEGYIAEPSLVMYENKKPTKIYPSRKIDIPNKGPKVNIYIKKKINLNIDINSTTSIEKALHEPDEQVLQKDIVINYFGSTLEFNIPEGIQKAKFYPQNQNGIKNFFDLASVSEYETLLKDIQSVIKKLKINDWGIYLLINKVGEKIFSSQNDIKLFNWFLFNKLGYSVRVGLSNKHIILLHQSNKVIYGVSRFKIDKKYFYILDQTSKEAQTKIYTYKDDYPNAHKDFSLSLKVLPKFTLDEKTITLNFKIDGEKYSIKNVFNQNLIDFMGTYPQADYETFFNTPLDDMTYYNIAVAMKKIIDTKKASKGIDFILKFVQKAFKYELDEKQFGKEKVMFAQETLFYEKSDCEDRAILFAYLVKKLLNIGVVGIKYKDHMATALYIPMKGDNVRINAKKYVIADPTYVNSTLGQSMPKYKGLKPESYIFVNK